MGGAAADPEDPSSSSGSEQCCGVATLSVAEREEVGFQRAWLAYMWARATSAGVEPQVMMNW